MSLLDGEAVLLPRREISLHVRSGSLRGAFFPTSWAELLLIGRAPSNHIVLPHRLVSAHHCLLVRLWPGIKFLLLDARSRHGTWVNDRPVERSEVTLGDRISIGPFNLEFVDAVSVQRPPYAERPAADRPALFGLEPHRRKGPPVPLPPASATVVGSSRQAHVRVKDPTVTDFHCLIATQPRDDGRAPVLIDLRSDNGTYVKREPIHRKRLHPNNIITLGRSQFILRRSADLRPVSAHPRVTPAAPHPGLPTPTSSPRAARARHRPASGPMG